MHILYVPPSAWASGPGTIAMPTQILVALTVNLERKRSSPPALGWSPQRGIRRSSDQRYGPGQVEVAVWTQWQNRDLSIHSVSVTGSGLLAILVNVDMNSPATPEQFHYQLSILIHFLPLHR